MTLLVVAEDMTFALCVFSAGNLNWFEKTAFSFNYWRACVMIEFEQVRTKLVD